jgi:hypothetical protein
VKVVVGGQEISLDRRDVAMARASVNKLLAVMKKSGTRVGHPGLYLTTVLVMYLKSIDIIECVEPENIKELMDVMSGGKKKTKE